MFLHELLESILGALFRDVSDVHLHDGWVAEAFEVDVERNQKMKTATGEAMSNEYFHMSASLK
jgi:hypothetical protein